MGKLENINPSLLYLARGLTQQGWSVIPLRGEADLNSPKAPALSSWKHYQGRLATDSELIEWFQNRQFNALGIVLGRVSNLVVLDIDSPEQAARFQQECPELTQTFTVSSGNRNLPHYYFKLPYGMVVPSRNTAGAELRSDGQYVVAPLVSINGATWEIANPANPHMLTKNDLRRLLGFMRLNTYKQPETPLKTASHAIFNASGLIRRYHRLAGKHGRNNALFYVACYAREHGFLKSQVEDALVDIHALKSTQSKHTPETLMQRRKEAIRTINSAFSRAARDPHKTYSVYQLPNAIREKLLQMNLDRVARVIDGLMMAGFQLGQQFTVKMAYAALKDYGIGRNTIIDVLSQSSPQTPHLANAAKRYAVSTKKCFFGRVADSVKTPGRPVQIFVMPGVDDLCELLDVQPNGCDPITVDDLKSPTAYRAALHLALIQRAPGKYARRWQAQRLGISQDTCRRYERQKGIQTIPTFHDTDVRFFNVEQVIPDDPLPGQFLQDDAGKRYPAHLRIAQKLLKAGKKLMFRQQDVNHYFVPDVVNVRCVVDVPIMPERVSVVVDMPSMNAPVLIQNPIPQLADVQIMPEQIPVATLTPSMNTPALSPEFADYVYETLRKINPDHALTRKRAKALIQRFDERLIRRGLAVIHARSDIDNPAGFLQMWLKCSGTEHSLR